MIDFELNIDLDEMWLSLGKYQRFADADGHGGAWRRMCELRTQESASQAALQASQAWWRGSRKTPTLIAALAATWAAEYASGKSEMAMRLIEQAIKEREHVSP
jgi:hypothetical protein